MSVFVHSDAHFASIANSLILYPEERNPAKDMQAPQIATILKRENIRSYNFATSKRQKLELSRSDVGCLLNTAELIKSIIVYENEASMREDFHKSDAGKIVDATYRFLPTCLPEYNTIKHETITIADCIKSFAHQETKQNSGWHWDENFNIFEPSTKISRGRVKPYPWLINQLRTVKDIKLPYVDAVIPESLHVVKFLLEYTDLPDNPTSKNIYNSLLKHHIINIPEVVRVPIVGIE